LIKQLRERGVTVDATIVEAHERWINAGSASSWITSVEVTFTDVHGRTVQSSYTEQYARLCGKRPGQTIAIFYDPERPSMISPVDRQSGRPNDPRTMEVFWLGLGAIMLVALAVYFLIRAG
jgi:hypothetical protein